MECAVFFNLDNTLTRMNRDFGDIYIEAVERAGLEEVKDSYEEYKSGFFRFFQDGWAFPRRQAMDSLCRDRDCYDPEKVEKFAEVWEELEAESLDLKPGVENALEALSSKGFGIGILSNGTNRLQNLKLEKLGIKKYFDAVVVSAGEGIRKPQKDIFDRARELLKADRYVMVSHLLRDDVIAARRADFEAVWISEKEPEQGIPEDVALRVGSFEELPGAVENICSAK
ncbi:MAG: HAD family hydrolase [Candidatus Nanohaloarchaea archaeon]|nr:HAD family hydrolase [Candidatus Nanohaloarchaea archaeon]